MVAVDLAGQGKRLDLVFLGNFSNRNDSMTFNTRVADAEPGALTQQPAREQPTAHRQAVLRGMRFPAQGRSSAPPPTSRTTSAEPRDSPGSASGRRRPAERVLPLGSALARRLRPRRRCFSAASRAASRSVSVLPRPPSPRCAMLPRGCEAEGPWGRLALLLLLACATRASEITFELPDNAKQCFYEEIAQGTKCTLEFQVAAEPGSAPRGLA